MKKKLAYLVVGGISAVTPLVAQTGVAHAFMQGNVKGNWASATVAYDTGDKKAYAWFLNGSGFLGNNGGVAAMALCQRGNGGTQWYTSTNYRYGAGSPSTYDCDNNRTCNRALTNNDFHTKP